MKKSNYQIKENQMFYKNQPLFKAKGLIKSFLIVNSGVAVLVKGDEVIGDRNIYFYKFNGQLKWQVEHPDKLHESNYYTAIYLSEDNKLQAYSMNGVEYTLNEEDGRILKKELIK
jgi:hypothetical protein